MEVRSVSSHLATAEEAAGYVADGWWREESLAEVVEGHASLIAGHDAIIGSSGRFTWDEYARASCTVMAHLAAMDPQRGDRVAVLLPDSPVAHAVYVGIERTGLVAVGIGPRAGRREIEHLLDATGARVLISPARHREHDVVALVASLRDRGPLADHVVVEGTDGSARIDGQELLGTASTIAVPPLGRRPDELFLLNSTSGTTGLPKVVMHTMNRWYGFHRLAVEAGELTSDDVFMSVIPAPFGFGLWTAHFTPTLLAAPCVVMERFTPAGMVEAIERHRVTVLSAVSTQFIMMLSAPNLLDHDVSSLRILFTGGEAVPYERAARFEEETGASVLQFFGSNETGALSVTTTTDSRERRLRTAGRVIPVMQVRLFGDDGEDVTASGGPGQPACRGPVTCLGYDGEPEATAELVAPGGWMFTGDIVTVDDDGYLSVVGRKSDFIIRGGKNISAPSVEEAVLAVPGVAMAAAVPAPSSTFGERVCAYVVADPGAHVDLNVICASLGGRGVTKETWPELLVVVDDLPMASGGKISKAALREDAARRVADGRLTT